MEAEDQAYPGTDYATQQPLLLRLTLWLLPAALVLALLAEIFR